MLALALVLQAGTKGVATSEPLPIRWFSIRGKGRCGKGKEKLFFVSILFILAKPKKKPIKFGHELRLQS